MKLRRARVPGPLVASILLLVALAGCNPFAPSPPPPPTPDTQASLAQRAEPLLRSGMDKLNRGDYRGAIQDLEEARVYLPAGDPRLQQVDEALQRARLALTPTVAPTATPTPTGPPVPSRAAPNTSLGERTFGRVYLAVVPAVASEVPTPVTTFSDQEQPAVYVERLASATDFRLRVFRMPAGDFLGEVGPQPPAAPPVEWYNTLIWYHDGPEQVGLYRAELYAGPTLTNAFEFTVRQAPATATPAPPPSPAPAPPAPPAPPPSPPPPTPVPSPTTVFTPTATPTARPPAPAALGSGIWRALPAISNAGLVRGIGFIQGRGLGGTVVAAAENGLYRSVDGGQSWQPARLPSNAPGFYSVLYIPQQSEWMAAGYREGGRSGLYISRDDAQSFDEYGLLGQPVDLLALSPDGSTVIAGARPQSGRQPGTLYRSTDAGRSWAPVLNLGDQSVIFTSVLFSPDYGSDATLYASAGGVPGPVPTPRPGQPGQSSQPRTYGTVFRSSDRGTTWLVRDQVAVSVPERHALQSVWALAALPAGGNPDYTLFAGVDSGMMMSGNAGDAWTIAPDRPTGAGQAGLASGSYVVDLIAPEPSGLIGVLCPGDKASLSREQGGIEWSDCQTAVWTAGTGVWQRIGGEFATSGEARIGTVQVGQSSDGSPVVLLGADGGRIFLYSISPFP